jgi:hypothetical protein
MVLEEALFFLPFGCDYIVQCRKFHVCSSDTVCGRKVTSVNNASFHLLQETHVSGDIFGIISKTDK